MLSRERFKPEPPYPLPPPVCVEHNEEDPCPKCLSRGESFGGPIVLVWFGVAVIAALALFVQMCR